MQTHTTISCEDVYFRPPYLSYALPFAGLLGAGLACGSLALRYHPGWLVGAVLAVVMIIVIVARYTADGLIIRGYDLVVRAGTWNTREIGQPIWDARPDIVQSLPGRIFGYGSVTLTIDGKAHTVCVAQLRAFLRLVTAHRLLILGLIDRQALLQITSQPRGKTGELEDWHR